MSEDELVADVERRMIVAYPRVPADYVVAVVGSARAHFADSTVRKFIPLLVERRARRELTSASAALEQAAGGSDRRPHLVADGGRGTDRGTRQPTRAVQQAHSHRGEFARP